MRKRIHVFPIVMQISLLHFVRLRILLSAACTSQWFHWLDIPVNNADFFLVYMKLIALNTLFL